jgi:hypothetical protein
MHLVSVEELLLVFEVGSIDQYVAGSYDRVGSEGEVVRDLGVGRYIDVVDARSHRRHVKVEAVKGQAVEVGPAPRRV